MSMNKNAFGGGNPNSLYVPMSDVEQEVLARLVEGQDLRVHVLGWGVVNNPRVTFGDLRLQIAFRLQFDRPPAPGIPVYYFDLELKTGAGLLLFKDRKSVTYKGNPIMAAAGVFFDLVWDIAITAIDPKVVKALKPEAKGLTSRLQDKDTGQFTLAGNMNLTTKKRNLLLQVREGEARARASNARDATEAVAKSKGK